jgi:hypothetical protein
VQLIEGLSTIDFLDFGRDRHQIVRYLPDEQDLNHIDKKWLCDVLYTVSIANDNSSDPKSKVKVWGESKSANLDKARVFAGTLMVWNI